MRFEPLKQGQSIPLTSEYDIQLIVQDDLADILVMLENPKVTEYLFFAPAPESLYRGFFQPIIDDTQVAVNEGRWPEHPTVIIRDKSGRYMGMGGLTQVMLLEGNFEVGHQLPEHAWGKGIATAVCKTLTQLAFESLNAHKVAADCYAGNVGSYKTLEKCGYQQEGRSVDYYKLENGFDDRLYYGLSAADYERLVSK
ncbi:N-acetyltransferase [Photobacterium sanctipauli]|uniref:N-acetyltransferase n=1 Tax=Photobacterium sanctipauli TaxID=1342794 RepID=A0A2T3P0D5_9GAMM|nr:GNAT family protein [Photobacterium sanctipauli]PSW21970.1 N-acetyltransferase [Photobacterium sanctipauli]